MNCDYPHLFLFRPILFYALQYSHRHPYDHAIFILLDSIYNVVHIFPYKPYDIKSAVILHYLLSFCFILGPTS